jgi:5'-3' exonuclease
MLSVVTNFDQLRVERFKRATEDKLRDVRCPEHNKPPRIRFQGTSLHEITISLSGCCSKLMEIANARIGSPGVNKGLGEAGSAKAS